MEFEPTTPDRADLWITELGLGEDWIALADPDRAWVTTWGSPTGQPQWSYTAIGSDGRITWEQRGVFARDDVIIEALLAAE